MGYSIFSHNHIRLVGCKINYPRRMILVNLHLTSKTTKSYWKKCILLDFQRLNWLLSWFELYLCLPVFTWVSKINFCKNQLRSSTTIDKAVLVERVPQLALDTYYTLCPSVISFDKNLSYLQISKLNLHISLHPQNLPTWSLKL